MSLRRRQYVPATDDIESADSGPGPAAPAPAPAPAPLRPTAYYAAPMEPHPKDDSENAGPSVNADSWPVEGGLDAGEPYGSHMNQHELNEFPVQDESFQFDLDQFLATAEPSDFLRLWNMGTNPFQPNDELLAGEQRTEQDEGALSGPSFLPELQPFLGTTTDPYSDHSGPNARGPVPLDSIATTRPSASLPITSAGPTYETVLLHPPDWSWATDDQASLPANVSDGFSSDWVLMGSNESNRSTGSSWTNLRLTPGSDSQQDQAEAARAQTEAHQPTLEQPTLEVPGAPEASLPHQDAPERQEASHNLPSTGSLKLVSSRPAPFEVPKRQTGAGVRKASKVKGKLTEQKRENAKVMRKLGSCLRCRVYNLGCDPSTPCAKCKAVMENPRQFFGPCYRDKIGLVKLARHGNGNFGQRNVAFVDYFFLDKNAEPKNLEIRWNLPGGRPVDLPLLKLTCKEFVPRNEETHHITWNVGGQIITVKLPPFVGDDTKKLRQEVNSFLDHGMSQILAYILEDISDDLVRETLTEAIRWNGKHHSETVDLALRIRCASFCSQGWGSITGAESLGIQTVNFNEKGECGYAAYDRGTDKPLPLSIDHQLDVALLLTIQDHQEKILKKLSKMIFPPRTQRPPWYEIFLTIFVLLSNLEYVHGGSLSFYLAQNKTSNASACYSLTQEMIEEYTYSAENLLHHFCAILRANIGFKVATERMHEVKDREGLDEAAVEYMSRVLKIVPNIGFSSPHSSRSGSSSPQLPSPDGRWIMRLFEGVKRR